MLQLGDLVTGRGVVRGGKLAGCAAFALCPPSLPLDELSSVHISNLRQLAADAAEAAYFCGRHLV